MRQKKGGAQSLSMSFVFQLFTQTRPTTDSIVKRYSGLQLSSIEIPERARHISGIEWSCCTCRVVITGSRNQSDFYLRKVRLISGPMTSSSKFASMKLWCLVPALNCGRRVFAILFSFNDFAYQWFTALNFRAGGRSGIFSVGDCLTHVISPVCGLVTDTDRLVR